MEETFTNILIALIQKASKHATMLIALFTVYSYVLTYQYELGACLAYNIPDGFISMSSTQIVSSTITLTLIILVIGLIIYLLLPLVTMFTTNRLRRSFLTPIKQLLLFNLIVYVVVQLLFDDQSVIKAISPLAYWLMNIMFLIQFSLVLLKHLFTKWKQKKIKLAPEAELISVTPNEPIGGRESYTLFITLLLIVLFVLPFTVKKAGYKISKQPSVYSVIVNRKTQHDFALVKRLGDLTFAKSYRDSTFTDSLLVLSSDGLDTLKLKRKHINFAINPPSVYQLYMDKFYRALRLPE